MLNRIVTQLLTLVLLLFLVSSCKAPQPKGPDLVPVRASANQSFCVVNNNGDLMVYVKNIGDVEAASVEVEVEFFVGPGYTVKKRGMGVTGPLKPGETSSAIIVEVPKGEFDPDYEFRIFVDILNEVTESNENNNSANGAFVG